MANLVLSNINKIYPNGVQAVYDFNLEIVDKEFIVLVGPSGCGKSTTLRMVAGLEDITSGDLYIDSEHVNDKVAKDRNIAMVFQSYALYPHMSVYDNMAFGLKLRKMPKNLIHEKVRDAAEILGLTSYLERKPKALSGGQRQRVALGRAIVRNAKVFLMDEPLSNLDAKLRVQMRGELIKLHNRLNTTTIYVTHDQIEAMTMATRLVVMNDGFVMQVGSPKEVYEKPNNMFVGGFLGTPPMNFVTGVVSKDGTLELKDGQKLTLEQSHIDIIKKNDFFDKDVIVGIRPEDLFETTNKSGNVLKVIVDVAELLGSDTNVYFNVGTENLCAAIGANQFINIGDELQLELNIDKVHFFNPTTQVRMSLEEEKELKELEEIAIRMNEIKRVDSIVDASKQTVDQLATSSKNVAKNNYVTKMADAKSQLIENQKNGVDNAKEMYSEAITQIKAEYKEALLQAKVDAKLEREQNLQKLKDLDE